MHRQLHIHLLHFEYCESKLERLAIRAGISDRFVVRDRLKKPFLQGGRLFEPFQDFDPLRECYERSDHCLQRSR